MTKQNQKKIRERKSKKVQFVKRNMKTLSKIDDKNLTDNKVLNKFIEKARKALEYSDNTVSYDIIQPLLRIYKKILHEK